MYIDNKMCIINKARIVNKLCEKNREKIKISWRNMSKSLAKAGFD